MVQVKLVVTIKGWGIGWQAGDVVTVPSAVANALIAGGQAEAVP
jgi:hypothetical protein